MNKIILVVAILRSGVAAAIALTIAGCQRTYKSKFEILTTPNSTLLATSSPKPTATSSLASRSATPTPQERDRIRIYVPVYQNPIIRKATNASPT